MVASSSRLSPAAGARLCAVLFAACAAAAATDSEAASRKACTTAAAPAQPEAASMKRAQRAQGCGLLQHRMQTTAQDEQQLVAPLPNDTISEEYWSMINERISQHEHASAIAGGPTGNNAELVSGLSASAPEASNWSLDFGKYLGNMSMDRLFEKEKLTASGAEPWHEDAAAQFVAQCPMIMFDKEIYIEAPRCDREWGAWKDPADGFRPILAWKPRESGGIDFGVDSVVQGPGAVRYATLEQSVGVSAISFQLANCLDTIRYYVEEEVVKVNSISQGVSSTSTSHDLQESGVGFFYRYHINAPNGTEVAKTDLFRLNQDTFNVTMVSKSAATGALVVTAHRYGAWKKNEWRECDGTTRGWSVIMQMDPRDVRMATTVMDIRVAATAIVTLMAFRDESVDESSGITYIGVGHFFKSLFYSVLMLAIGVGIAASLLWYMRKQGIDAKLTRFFFKLEGAVLPKKAFVHYSRQTPFVKLRMNAPPAAPES